MSKEAHPEPIVDAAIRRRHYVWRKAGAYSIASAIGAISCLGCVAAVYALCFLFWAFLGPECEVEDEPCLYQWPIARPAMIAIPVGVLIGIACCAGSWSVKRKADRIPYVSPVADQLAEIPAQQVLLRGSGQPAAAPDELLRAASAGAENLKEEALRADCAPR
jgi:hypothetical protein